MKALTYVCQTIVVFVLVSAPDRYHHGETKTVPKEAQTASLHETASAASSRKETDTERDKIVGKGAYFLEERRTMSGIFLIHPLPRPVPKDSELLEFTRKNPGSEIADDALLLAAKRFFKKKQYDRTMRILDTIIERYPHSAHVHENVFMRLVLLLREADEQRAQAAKVRAHYVREHPDFTADVAILCKAVLYEELGKRAEAVKLLEQYVADFPAGRWAVEDAEIRPRLKPFSIGRTDEMIFHQLARLYHEGGEHGKACKILSQAKGSSLFVHYHDLLATIHRKTGSATKEADALERLRELMLLTHQPIPPRDNDMNKLPLNDPWRVWRRIRSLEQINQRLRTLGAQLD